MSQSRLRRYALLSSTIVSAIAGSSVANESRDNEDPVELAPVVVTASGYSQAIKDAPASISIVSKEALNQTPFENIGKVLGNLEGVSIERGGKSGGANISIRGLPNAYTLLLVDGKRISQNSSGVRPNGFGDVDTNFIPPSSAIERIEVVRGPMSTLYGSDALGGVINVITKKIPNQWAGEISAYHIQALNSDFGSHRGTNIYVSGPLQDGLLGLALMGNFQHSENATGRYASNFYEKLYGPSFYTGKISDFSGLGQKKNFTLGGKLSFTPNNENDLFLDVAHGVQIYDNKNNQLGTRNSAVSPGKTGGGYSDHLRFDRTKVNLSHEGRYAFATIDSSLLWDETHTIGRLNPITKPATLDNGQPRNIRYQNIIFDHKWLFNAGDHYINAGTQYRHQTLKDTLEGAPLRETQWQWALFAEDEWLIRDNVITTLGLRYDRNEEFGDHFSPRLYVVWDIDDYWQLKGGLSRAFRAPDINLMSEGTIGLGRQGTVPLIGNPDLSPETATSLELALRFDNNDGFAVTATTFYTRFKNKIESLMVPNCRVNNSNNCVEAGEWLSNGKPVSEFYQYFNVNNAKIYGLELGVDYQISKEIGIKINYTLTESHYLEGGRKIPFSTTPKHRVNIRTNWNYNEYLNLWLEGEYRAQQYNGLNWHNEKTYYAPYTLVNLGVNYQVRKDLAFSAGVDNVLDKNFVNYHWSLVGSGAPTFDSQYENRFNRIQEGRRLWASLKYTF